MDSTRDSTGDLPPMLVPQHNLARYLRVELQVADGVVMWRVRRALLGVIPMGIRLVEVPVRDVASIRMRGRPIRPIPLVIGLAAALVAPWLLPWWGSVPVAVVGIWVALVSFAPELELVTRSGSSHRAPVCFGHRFDAELYIDAVDEMAGASV